MRGMKIPKLLAPVRDRVSLTTAINAGADQVYFGLGELNMRASSRGVGAGELAEVTEQARSAGVEVFVTLNSIIYEPELERVAELVGACKAAGVNGVICHDSAVIQECLRQGVSWHVSTQANVSNSVSARFYEEMGAECVVLARECTLEQIREIKGKVGCEIEVFGHGAMCVSVSGRCFLSQFLDCKSANRGECSQPCRRNYKIVDMEESGHELEVGSGYVLSPKDLCTIRILDKICEAGVDRLKIEGRGRPPEYIDTVVRAYREGLDAVREGRFEQNLCEGLLARIKKVYNRGFSEGFLFGRPGREGWAEGRDNQATERKEFVGKVVHYYPRVGVMEVKVQSGEVRVGDKLVVQGVSTGVVWVEVGEVRQHEEEGVVTVAVGGRVRAGDEVYRMVQVK